MSAAGSGRYKLLLLVLAGAMAAPAAAQDSPEPLLDRLRSALQQDYLSLGLLIQVVGDYQDTRTAPGNNGFSLGNARVRLSGRLDGGFDYLLQTSLTQTVSILDARVGYRMSPAFGLDAGLFKVPFSRELLTPASSIDFVNRSTVVRALTPGRELGLAVRGRLAAGHVEYSAGAFNGNRSAGNDDNRLLFAGRVGFRPWGGGTARRQGELAVNLAGSRDQDGDVGLVPDFQGRRFLYGIDTRWQLDRWLLAAELIGAKLEPTAGGRNTPVGWHATAGRSLGHRKEHQVLLRWDAIRPDGLGPDRNFLLLGWNHWPTGATEVQVNWIVDLDRTAVRYQQGLVNLQIAF